MTQDDQLLENTGIHDRRRRPIQVTLPVYVTKELQLTMDFEESAGAQHVQRGLGDRAVHHLWFPATAAVLNEHGQHRSGQLSIWRSWAGSTNYSYAIPMPEGCENLSGVTRATLQHLLQGYAAHHG